MRAAVKREGRREFYHYKDIMVLEELSMEKFISAIERGFILIDFDARTGHNHGTKFRLRQDRFHELYEVVEHIE